MGAGTRGVGGQTPIPHPPSLPLGATPSSSRAHAGSCAADHTCTPAPLPTNDTCATAMTLNFGIDGIATHEGTSLYGLDQYKGLCPAPNNLGADTIYELDAGTGQTLTATVTVVAPAPEAG